MDRILPLIALLLILVACRGGDRGLVLLEEETPATETPGPQPAETATPENGAGGDSTPASVAAPSPSPTAPIGPTQATPTTEVVEVESPGRAWLVDQLRREGAAVTEAGAVAAPVFSAEGRRLQVNGLEVPVYEFARAATAVAEAQGIAPEGAEIAVPGRAVARPVWDATPHFFQYSRLIVQFVGDDPALFALLESVLGPQVAGGPAPAFDGQALPASLPPLPAGGAAIGGEVAFNPTDPLAGAAFSLATTLPAGPPSAPALLLPTRDGRAEFERAMTLLGFAGPLYMEAVAGFPEQYWLRPEYDHLLRTYRAVDGARELTGHDEGGVYYADFSGLDTLVVNLPYQEAAVAAEAFLRQRGLINFPVVVALPETWSIGVDFQRLVDGHRVLMPEFSAAVSDAGQVYLVNYAPLTGLVRVGAFPLVPAAAAWAQLQTGRLAIPAMATVYDVPPDTAPGPSPNTRHWRRPLAAGQPLTIISHLTALLPADGAGLPRVRAGNFWLQASPDDLRGLAALAPGFARLQGTVLNADAGDLSSWLLAVSAWDALDQQLSGGYSGTITVEGDSVLVHEIHHETYRLVDPPAGLVDGASVQVEGWLGPEPAAGYRELQWLALSASTVPETGPEPGSANPPPVVSPPPISEVVIDEVTLAYFLSPDPVMASLDGGPARAYTLFQPVWRFSGPADPGRVVVVVVRAAAGGPGR